MTTFKGRVVMSTGDHCLVADSANEIHRCQLRSKRKQRPVCGDWVQWQAEAAGNVIEAIQPRGNVIERGDFRGHPRPLAANIDQLILVIAPEPAPDTLLIDRYLVLAEAVGIPLFIYINKTDLLTAENESVIEPVVERYQTLGVELARGSTQDPASIERARSMTAGRTVILVGQSGVGKSSLTQALIPSLELRIGDISEISGQGRHTTTETTLFAREDGGALIDSPGVRTLRLDHLTPDQITAGFRDIAAWAEQCRFRDCRHDAEPGCAVAGAVARGELAAERVDNWRRLCTESQPSNY